MKLGARPDLQWIHQHAVSCLETSVERFGKHKRREVVEALVMLAKSDNPIFTKILENPRHVSHMVLIEALSGSPHDGIVRLLLDFFDNPQAPVPVLNVAANRCDMKFIRNFLNKVDRNPSDAVLQNLKRMGNIAWLQSGKNVANDLDEAAQRSLVFFVMSLGIAQAQIFSTIEYILLRGKPSGRREAARALAAFNGPEANRLAVRALGDADAQVQANVIPHLRRRGIPGILQRFVVTLDSPHLAVRQAARRALSEFSFTRFLGTFEMLDDEARNTTAAIVKKIDQHTIPLLRDELQAQTHSRRCADCKSFKPWMSPAWSKKRSSRCSATKTMRCRAEAALTLSGCRSPAVRSALEIAVQDRSDAVREAAKKSLKALTT